MSTLTRSKLALARGLAAAGGMGVSLMFAATAYAGVGVGVTPSFPSSVTVGDNNVAVSLTITNTSNSGDGNPLTLNSIKLIPSCGDISGSSCTTPDPDVFNVDAAGTGAGSCAANTFTIAETNGTTGEVTFTPNAPISLTPGQTCTINFTVDTVALPDVDATGAAGMQTLQLATVAGTDQLQQPGSGSGSDTTTVVPPPMGRIIVVKNTNVATSTQFEFDSSWGPNFMLSNGQSSTTGSTTPGTYSVSEINLPANWTLASSSCSDGSSIGSINLAANEIVTCTFNNVFTPPPPPASEWCSPGYWKNHPEEAAQALADGGNNANTTYASQFGSAPARSNKGVKDGAPTNPTLLQVISNPQWYGGAAANNVADLFSEDHTDVDFSGTRVENCPLN